MPYNQGEQEYKKIQVQTTNPGKLIVLLYNGAIKYLNIAKQNMETFKKYDVVNENIQKTQDIIDELLVSLDMSRGEIAEKLFNIYMYVNKLLLEANVEKDVKKIDLVLALLAQLRDAWDEISQSAGIIKENTADTPKKSINIAT